MCRPTRRFYVLNMTLFIETWSKMIQRKPQEWTYSSKQGLWTKRAQCGSLEVKVNIVAVLGQCWLRTEEEAQLSFRKLVGELVTLNKELSYFILQNCFISLLLIFGQNNLPNFLLSLGMAKWALIWTNYIFMASPHVYFLSSYRAYSDSRNRGRYGL